MITGEKPPNYKWGSHADALALLLRMRSSDKPSSSFDSGLVRMANGVVVSRNHSLEAVTDSLPPDDYEYLESSSSGP